jgi:hypothetical protein
MDITASGASPALSKADSAVSVDIRKNDFRFWAIESSCESNEGPAAHIAAHFTGGNMPFCFSAVNTLRTIFENQRFPKTACTE